VDNSKKPEQMSDLSCLSMWYNSHATRRIRIWLLELSLIVLPYKKIKN